MKIFNTTKISNKYVNLQDIQDRMRRILKNPVFARNASNPNNDWIEVKYSIVVDEILNFLSETVAVKSL